MEKERKYYIPAFIYTTGEADESPKSELIEVNEDVYRAYYRPVWQARDHAKRHGGCSTADWKKCSGDCGTCSYRVPSRTFDSVEYLVEDHCTDDAFKLDDIADMVTDTLMQSARLNALNALDPQSKAICETIAAGLNERDAAAALGMSKTTYHDRKQRLLARLRSEWADLF